MRTKKKRYATFIMIPRFLYKKREWTKDLTARDRDIYIFLKHHFNGANNGEIKVSYKRIKDVLGHSNSTISKALKKLQEGEWIKVCGGEHPLFGKLPRGGMLRNGNVYTLTGKHDSHIRKSLS